MPVLTVPEAAADAQNTAPAATVAPVPDEPYDPRIASAGFTLDTPLGPIDLVAVERAGRGWHEVTLTVPEQAWVAQRQARGARRRAATLLGVGYGGWLTGLQEIRERIDPVALARALRAEADRALDQGHRAEVAAHAALAEVALALLALDDAQVRMNAAAPEHVGLPGARAALHAATAAADRLRAAQQAMLQARDACLTTGRYAQATGKAATTAATRAARTAASPGQPGRSAS